MTLKRGDVVIVRFPFSSGSGAKFRPALVIQNDRNNSRLLNVILAAITTTVHRDDEPTQYLLRVRSAEGKQSGILKDSVVTCENIVTVEQSLIHRTIGSLPAESMHRVDACVRAALGLH